MAWEFSVVSASDKFFVNLAMVQPNQTHNFYNDKYIISKDNPSLTYRYDILLLLEGSLRLDIQNHQPVIISYDDYVWDGDTDDATPTIGYQLRNTNPFGYDEHSIYPLTDWASMTGMSEGAKWINIKPIDQQNVLEFECFKGPHIYQAPDVEHYVVVLSGTTRIDFDVMNQYEIRKYEQGITHFAVDAQPEDTIIYVWEKFIDGDTGTGII